MLGRSTTRKRKRLTCIESGRKTLVTSSYPVRSRPHGGLSTRTQTLIQTASAAAARYRASRYGLLAFSHQHQSQSAADPRSQDRSGRGVARVHRLVAHAAARRVPRVVVAKEAPDHVALIKLQSAPPVWPEERERRQRRSGHVAKAMRGRSNTWARAGGDLCGVHAYSRSADQGGCSSTQGVAKCSLLPPSPTVM